MISQSLFIAFLDHGRILAFVQTQRDNPLLDSYKLKFHPITTLKKHSMIGLHMPDFLSMQQQPCETKVGK